MSGSVQDRANSTRYSGGMALIRGRMGSSRTTAVLTFGLVANLAPLATFAAVMPRNYRRLGADRQ